jgi:uncharacterized protein YbaP (TraB family)
LLESAHRDRSGVDATADVHDMLLSLARDSGKVIRTELPDADATLFFFANLGDAAEIEYLMWTFGRVAQQRAEIREQVAAWLVGDGSVVETQVIEMQRKYPALYRRLLAERNRAWVPRIEEMLRQPGSTLVLAANRTYPVTTGYRLCSLEADSSRSALVLDPRRTADTRSPSAHRTRAPNFGR